MADFAGDNLRIRQLELTCSIGVYEWEKQVPQQLYVDIDLPLDVARAAASDELEDTLDYTRLVAVAKEVAGAQHYNLVETLVVRLADALLQEFGLSEVKVCINKPAAIPEAEATIICISRKA